MTGKSMPHATHGHRGHVPTSAAKITKDSAVNHKEIDTNGVNRMLLRRPWRTDQKHRFLDKVWTPQFSTTPPKSFLLSFSTHLVDQTLARSIWKRKSQFSNWPKDYKSMTDRASSTAAEQRRREVDYARPARQRTIAFRSLFQSFTKLRSTALWAGAGCGKSGTCSLVAQLHAKGQLWTFFSVLLLWRLRYPRVQRATSLEQLLQVLLPDSTQSKRLKSLQRSFLLWTGEESLLYWMVSTKSLSTKTLLSFAFWRARFWV